MSARPSRWSRIGPAVAVLVLWGGAFAMACRFEGNPLLRSGYGQSVLDRILGASRGAFSRGFFEQADMYFHKGIGYVRVSAITNSMYERLHGIIRPDAHAHAAGYKVSEIMPWLQFATQMDPHNVQAYLTMAHWLRSSIRRPDLAEEVLLDALRNNPRDYRIYNERARVAFQTKDDRKAAQLLAAAQRFWPGNENPEDEETLLDLSQILSRRAFLFELAGDRQAALQYFREVLRVRPGNEAVARRVKAMEQGADFSEADRKTWAFLFGAADDEHVHDEHCGHEDHDHESAEHGDGGCMTGGLH